MLNALWIVLLGMAIVFAVLGVLLAVMIILGRLVTLRNRDEQREDTR